VGGIDGRAICDDGLDLAAKHRRHGLERPAGRPRERHESAPVVDPHDDGPVRTGRRLVEVPADLAVDRRRIQP
jgi:hypothetical protein